MKKSLLALAVLGAFAGAASAQSSVTIYGSIDMSVAKRDGAAPSPGAPANEAWTIQQSNGSRLGFQGNEDLGGGLSAQFQIEHRYNPDTGALNNPNVFWQGRSYVQLSHAAMGRVYLGREYTPAFWPAVKSDPFGWDGVGQMGTMQWAGYLSTGGVRAPNSVGYRSPNWGGFTVNAAVGLGEAATSRMQGFNVEYGAGPIYAGFGYESLEDGPSPSATDGNTLWNAALHYDFGFAKLIGYYAQAELAAGTVDSKSYMIAAKIPVGTGTIKTAYIEVIPDGDNNDSSKFGLGYDHPLSKRTTLYADYGMATLDGVDDSNTFAFGIKHTF